VFGFRSFVATRYLLAPIRKVTANARKWVAIALAAQTLAWLLYIIGVEVGFAHVTRYDPFGLLATASDLFFIVAVAGGVLRHSKPGMFAFVFGIFVGLVGFGFLLLASHGIWIHADEDGLPRWALWTILGCIVGGFGLAGLAVFFGMLRAYFSFFTTVSIGGVFIGTAALVVVLSVMSGFESDLREKILGSNAHIQITREEGDFTEWHDVKKRIDNIPGVVASTPYAVSEVVIAANSNGMNVIIKGIDPATVGKVTELVHDLEPIGNPVEQAETLKRLEPLISDAHDLNVKPSPAPTGRIADPPPADMPGGGEPIDYTQPAPPEAPADSATGTGSGSGGNVAPEPPPDFAPSDVDDPPPADLLSTDDAPIDYSQPSTTEVDPTIHVIEVPPNDTPVLSRRTQALPGILVGRELVKQTHLYTGEEVRVVSPLSDPSNPDATGTPIPFNRDYRVAGIFFTGMYEYDLKYVYVSLDSLDEFLDRGDSVDGIEVRIGSPDDTGAYVQKIGEVLGPQYRVQDWKDLNRSLFSALKLEKIAMFLVLGIVILVASFSIVGNLIMIVVEKAREIALLKTLGGDDFGVMQIFIIQGLLIGLVGVGLGLRSGLIACWIGKRIGIPLNPDVYYIDRMPIHVETSAVMLIAAAGVLISLAATLYPALVAARVRPAAGMRH
jgi:lipoprotein-releasing system permease protein